MATAAIPAATTETFRLRISLAASWYMVILLSVTNAVAFIDRQALPLLVQQIEQDLHLTDTQMSIVIGAAFVVAWAILGLFAGVLVDRVNRKVTMAVGACIWGVMTISCGWATSFTTLCLGRMGVGIGESIAGPGSVSLIKDGVEPNARGRALGIYALGASIGAALALLGGGALLALLKDVEEVRLPVLGVMRSWQVVLAASGLLAFPLAGLLLTMRDPGRSASATDRRRFGGVGEAFGFVVTHWRVFLPTFIANGATIILVVSYQLWQPTLFARLWHLSRPEIGLGLGLITLLLSTTSQFCCGAAIDWLERRGVNRAPAMVGLGAAIAALLPAIFAPLAPTATLAWILAALYAFLTTGFFTTGLAVVTRLTPSRLVGRVASFHYFWVGMIGTGLGPAIIAVVSDHLYSGPGAISASMSTVSGLFDVVALLCFGWMMMTWPRPVAVLAGSADRA